MKECRVHREGMSSYLDGEVIPAQRAALEAHLARCPTCSAALEELRWTTRQIRGLEPVEPPPWMTAKIMARLHEDEAPSRSIWRRYFFPVIASAQFRVASLVLVGAAGYYIVSKSTGVPRNAGETRPAPEARESAGERARPPEQKLQKAQAQPAEKQSFAPPPPPPVRPADRKEKKDSVPPVSRPAQAPALDELNESGSPAAPAPVLAAKAAPAPMVSSADSPASAASESARDTAPRAAAPPAAAASPSRLGQAAPAAGAAAGGLRRRESAKAETGAPAATHLIVIRIEPFDPSGFSAVVERELARAGADVVKPPGKSDGHSLTARLESRRLSELLERLARAGPVHERPEDQGALPPVITVTIRW